MLQKSMRLGRLDKRRFQPPLPEIFNPEALAFPGTNDLSNNGNVAQKSQPRETERVKTIAIVMTTLTTTTQKRDTGHRRESPQ